MGAQNPPLPAPAQGRLLVCATPIGNLEDITLRVLAALAQADVLAAEDTRHTRILLDRHGIVAPLLVSLHEHNEREQARQLAARVAAGETVALVSDAGTPLVSDPGFALVRECLRAGLSVEVLPGPSAAVAALVASGLPAASWRFVGFLPRRGPELERLFEQAADTTVAFESPRRLARTLELFAGLDAERPAAVCRELTKLHEEVRRASVSELATHYRSHPPRGEVALVLGAAAPGARAREQARVALRELVDAGARPRRAASALARLTGVGANELYRELTRSG